MKGDGADYTQTRSLLKILGKEQVSCQNARNKTRIPYSSPNYSLLSSLEPLALLNRDMNG